MLGFFALGLLILFATSTILGIGTEGHLPIAEAQVTKSISITRSAATPIGGSKS